MPIKDHPTDPDKFIFVRPRYNLREWVGLTDEEIQEAWFTGATYDQFARMLEAKLKEKNS